MNSKKLLITAIIIISGIIISISCDQNELNSESDKSNFLLSEDEMIEFGISSIIQINFTDSIEKNLLKSTSKTDNTYLVEYVNSKGKAVIKLLPNNNFELYFYNEENILTKDAYITINNIDKHGYVNDFTVDSDITLHIQGDNYSINNPSNLKGYAKWSDCVGDAVTACYKEDLGCAALFTFTLPFAFSAVMIACI